MKKLFEISLMALFLAFIVICYGCKNSSYHSIAVERLEVTELIKQAQKGDADAQVELGRLYYYGGRGLMQDYAEAVELFQNAVDKGNVYGKYWLGHCYDEGNGVDENFTKANALYEEAFTAFSEMAYAGDAKARFYRGLCYYFQRGTGFCREPANRDYAFGAFYKAAKQGYATAQRSLGYCYEKGEGVEQSTSESEKWYHLAAEQGNTDTLFISEICFHKRKNVTKTYLEAVEGYRSKFRESIRERIRESRMKRSHPMFSHEINRMLDSDEKEAYLQTIIQMAHEGYGKCIFELGILFSGGYGYDYDYGYGYGVPHSYSEAVKCYRRAAEKGYADAQYMLGLCYKDGIYVQQSYLKAVKWWRLASGYGLADAQFEIGHCYYKGKGVEQSYAEAVKWYRFAAGQGLAQAQYSLGYCYAHGEGVEKSYTEAVKWYRLAAEQGHSWAQNNLGVCYANGHGVTKSKFEAWYWYKKAAKQGNKTAIQNLKELDL